MLTACDPAAGPSSNKNIRPSRGTNEVAQANLNLAIAYLKEGKYENALENLEKAKLADPGHSATYNVLGLLYQQINEPKKAEQNYKKAISLNSNDSSTMNNYGNFLCGQDRLEEALNTFSNAANNPLYATPEIALTNAGSCLYNNHKKSEAKEKFQEALQINPKVPQALIRMSEFALDDFNYLSARAYLQRFQEVSRHTARSLWLGIQIERELGDKDAVSSYALLLKNSFPDSDETAILLESKVK
ncbi:MAG: type IV pilus biogenesis/stability protein PilW [Proteobacteria bacterium]|nr:type IV pilus biogenesis/stability protein PilW [Pseudomonadota bacterium]